MINFIEGRLVLKQEGVIVVECGGIGYEIFVSNQTLSNLPYVNEICRILTYLQVKEDGLCLFGFYSQEEKNMFNDLISVNGIGPKVALSILSGIRISDLIMAIASQDIKMLCTIKGLGKKTAERLLVELKDKVSPNINITATSNINQNFVEQATDALVSLGVGKNEAYRLAMANAESGESVEQIITKCLKGMSN